jgi:hypothetical protein
VQFLVSVFLVVVISGFSTLLVFAAVLFEVLSRGRGCDKNRGTEDKHGGGNGGCDLDCDKWG